MLVPDAEPTFVRTKCAEFALQPNGLDRLVNWMFEHSEEYPKIKKPEMKTEPVPSTPGESGSTSTKVSSVQKA